jgi:hypothetical protein
MVTFRHLGANIHISENLSASPKEAAERLEWENTAQNIRRVILPSFSSAPRMPGRDLRLLANALRSF